MSDTTKIQKLIDQQAEKQVDQESRKLLDFIIKFLSDHPSSSSTVFSGGAALSYSTYTGGYVNKTQIVGWTNSGKAFKQPLLDFIEKWKKERLLVVQDSMTNDLLKKVDLLTA